MFLQMFILALRYIKIGITEKQFYDIVHHLIPDIVYLKHFSERTVDKGNCSVTYDIACDIYVHILALTIFLSLHKSCAEK